MKIRVTLGEHEGGRISEIPFYEMELYALRFFSVNFKDAKSNLGVWERGKGKLGLRWESRKEGE